MRLTFPPAVSLQFFNMNNQSMISSFFQRMAFTALVASALPSSLFAYDRAHVTLLQQGVAVWNNQRQATMGQTLDLSRAPLAKAQLGEANLAHVSLSSAFLQAANLRGANLQAANLRWSVLDGADLRDAVLVGAHLFEASLVKADARGANFKSATSLEQADLSGALVSNNTIVPSGERAHGQWALRHHATFVQEPERPIASIASAISFSPERTITSPPNSAPTTVSQSAVTAHPSNVVPSPQASAQAPITKEYARATLNGVNWSNADLAGANFYKADMKGAQLQGANLQGAHCDRAFLLQANLQGANLTKALLFGATLDKADLRNANLTEASLFGANCEGADLRGAILTRANVTDAVLTNALISSTTVLPSGKAATRQWALMQQAIFSQD
uniref:Pentapeptide repeat family protein n=1 Tax=Chlorobium chlorochromatii (strain CaD3) TaxID=340177 RepID=Q3APU6_CHLCH